MKKKKNNKRIKNYIIVGAIILLGLIASILIYYRFDSDGMNNKYIYNIKYRVYQNGKWSKYSKNGMIVGDKENPIQNIELKFNEKKGQVYYYTYTNTWSDQIYKSMKENATQIYGLEMRESDILFQKYTICYRTYNKVDKWLNWTCNGTTSGNKEEPITALEIKIIPNNGIKFDYLKDYNNKLSTSKNF